jgi:hypothetical protein
MSATEVISDNNTHYENFRVLTRSGRTLSGVVLQHAMKRVAVFGNAGGGKSALARRLAEITRLPLYVIDKLQFKDGAGARTGFFSSSPLPAHRRHRQRQGSERARCFAGGDRAVHRARWRAEVLSRGRTFGSLAHVPALLAPAGHAT